MCAHQIKGSNFCSAVKLHGNIFITIKCIIPRSLAPFFTVNIYLCKKTLNHRDPANKLLGDRTHSTISVSLVAPGSDCFCTQILGYPALIASQHADVHLQSWLPNSACIKKRGT